MKSPEERIKELVRAQSLGAVDGDRLLEAVRPSSIAPRRLRANPFDRWSGETTSLLGLGVALCGIATARLGARYDGALDLHVGHGPVPLGIAVLDQLLAFVVTAVVLWVAARRISRARFVDVLGAVGLSRAPLVAIAVPVALLVPLLPADLSRPGVAVLALALLALAGAGVQIFLLVLGFRTATGARGGRLAVALIAGLVAAEIVTKLVLVLVPR